MAIPHVPFYFVRHGQTDWNKENRPMGQTDIPLNATGLEQARLAAQNLHQLDFVKIISSPLQRALKTAQIIAQATHKPITVVDELKECSWGIMEGQPKDVGLWMQRWGQGDVIPHAEHRQDFLQRIIRGMNTALSDNELVLIVAHGGVYWAIQEVLQIPTGHISNCCIIAHRPPKDPLQTWHIEELNKKPNK